MGTSYLLSPVLQNLFDYHIYFDIIKENNIDKEPEKWQLNKKKFKITKKFSYFDKKNNIEYCVILTKHHTLDMMDT